MSYHLFCIYSKETIYCVFFKYSFLAESLRYSSKFQVSSCIIVALFLLKKLYTVFVHKQHKSKCIYTKEYVSYARLCTDIYGKLFVAKKVFFSFLRSVSDVAQLFLNLLENFRLVLLIKDLLIRKRVNFKVKILQAKA